MAIGFNADAQQAAFARNRIQNDPTQNFQRISSGSRINSAADDAAGLLISTGFTASISGTEQAIRNSNDAISLNQTAEGAVSSVQDDLQRIRELSAQSSNGTLTDQDRQGLQAEVDQLVENISETISGSDFNGISLLNDDSDVNFQVGPDAGDTLTLERGNLEQQLADLGINDINISTQAGAQSALGVVDDALDVTSQAAANFGANQNRLSSTIDNLANTVVNESAANSRIADADLAKEISELASRLVKEEAQNSAQAQANSNFKIMLRLFEG
ncbi:flagellin [Litoribacillus peritrichatus]|uniref:Flagellin n=1 Tax=Litoribacillus peritrichatus TaxID=718191 RepID=A0ABP7MIK4_9GAMM